MRNALRIVLLCLLVAALSTIARAQDPPAGGGEKIEAKPEPIVLFQGVVKGGSQVAVRLWGIHNKERVVIPAERGYMLVEFRGGSQLTTIVGEKRQDRDEGDFWIVPPGESMTIETGRHSVVVQTISLSAALGNR
jgi:hypothetical protein